MKKQKKVYPLVIALNIGEYGIGVDTIHKKAGTKTNSYAGMGFGF